jgi:hypothetical protein
MIKYKIKFLMLVLLLSDCETQSNKETINQSGQQVTSGEPMTQLSDTKWSYKIAEGCINTYHFKSDSQYVFYSCEMEDAYYGKYFVQNDTLHLYEYVTATDSLLSADSPERSEQAKFQLILVAGKLKHLARFEKINGIWQKSNFVFPENYVYTKNED